MAALGTGPVAGGRWAAATPAWEESSIVGSAAALMSVGSMPSSASGATRRPETSRVAASSRLGAGTCAPKTEVVMGGGYPAVPERPDAEFQDGRSHGCAARSCAT